MNQLSNEELKDMLEASTQYWEQTLDEKLDEILEQKLDKYFNPVIELLALLIDKKG